MPTAARNKGVKNKTELFLWVKGVNKNHVRRQAKKGETTMSKYVEGLIEQDRKK
jgi:hypothetical protein